MFAITVQFSLYNTFKACVRKIFSFFGISYLLYSPSTLSTNHYFLFMHSIITSVMFQSLSMVSSRLLSTALEWWGAATPMSLPPCVQISFPCRMLFVGSTCKSSLSQSCFIRFVPNHHHQQHSASCWQRPIFSEIDADADYWTSYWQQHLNPSLWQRFVNILFLFIMIITINRFLSPSGDLGIGLVWDNLSNPPHRTAAFWSDCWNPLQTELNYLWLVLSCSQDDIRWF